MARNTSTATPTKATAATKKAPEKVTEDVSEETTTRTRVRAADHTERVLEVITGAGEAGISLQDIAEATGLGYRVVHNVTWHLEGQPEPRKSSEDHGKLRNPDARRVHRGEGSRVRYFAGKGDKVPEPAKAAKAKSAKS